MLLRHSAAYLFARGLPGLINFAALAIYSRVLAPDDYGRYSLIVAGVSMVGVVVFQWHRLVLARWLATRQQDGQRFLGEILRLFLLLATATALPGLILAGLWPDPVWQRLLALAVVLLIAQEWVELNLVLAAAQLAPARYGRVLGAKTALALAVGTGLALLGCGAAAPLFGLAVGCALAVPLFGRLPWRGVHPLRASRQTVRAQLRYGLPLVATFALGWVVASSDRLLIGWLMDVGAAGRYAVGYDLAQNSLGVVLAIVQVAAYPLAVRALEEHGVDAAREQVRRNGELILTLALASAAVLAALAEPIAALVVGAEFRAATADLLPWVALAAAAGGIKAFHLDVAFHLGRRSRGLIVSVAVAAVANIILNLALIPSYQLMGAAYATLISYILGCVASFLLGKNLFSMPSLGFIFLRSIAIGLTTALGACAGRALVGGPLLGQLVAGVATASIVAGATAILLDIAGARAMLTKLNKNYATHYFCMLRKSSK